ncbi:hypothetical protein BDV96DRAFT_571966 [Lophiotrema nucula]|uniref:Uncharacterized protein n=1 Tax=Lophiotrema nucula TaxID=690887 RepID=A0A6A5ZG32_9PLEO|nr:hypothetical protein BDV96DRAFT_571966 [Lophiotrema nucula]
MQSSRWAPQPTTPQPAKEAVAPEVESAVPASSETPAASESAPNAHAEPAPVESSSVPPPSNMPYDYDYADPSIDPFAQTAGTDDLFFDDDFTPVAEPVVEQNPVDTPTTRADEPKPAGGFSQSQNIPRGPSNGFDRGRGGGRGRGRAARGRGQGRGGLQGHTKHAPPEKKEEREAEPKPEVTTPSEEPAPPTSSTEEPASTDVPTGPKDATPKAVRGDRTLTGGAKRTRLTEDELNAKLASMRLKNSALAEQHARAEADLANFEAREALLAQQDKEKRKQASERQKADRQNRQQMMGERERNRQRKLDAQQGREWDLEKEEGFSGTGEERRRGAARGAHGGVAPSPRPPVAAAEGWGDASEDAPSTPSQRGRGRGRGRGGRSARGGRGDHHTQNTHTEDQAPPSASDFPDLPSSTSKETKTTDGPKKLDFPIKGKAVSDIKTAAAETEPRPGVKKQESFGLSPLGPGKSWADQVDDI